MQSKKSCVIILKNTWRINMLVKIKKILADSCILFTVFVFTLMTAYSIINLSSPNAAMGLSFSAAIVLFGCAICMRVFHGILNVESIRMPIRITLHYALIMGTALCSLWLIREITGANHISSSLAFFVILSFFTVIYLAFCLVFFIVKKIKKDNSNAKKEYSSIIKK